MGAKGKLHGDFDLPIDYVGELVAASLRDGWRNLNYNDLLLEITADQNKTQNLSGFSLKNDFQATVRWQPQGERVRVSVEVLDREQQALERDCQKMAHAILQGVSERGATIKSSLARAKPRTNHGSARWATNEDLEKAGYVTDWEGGNKLLLGPGPGGKKLALPEDLTAMHSVVCGPTGCGKSSSIFIPNLIERVGISAIVTEATAGSEPPDLLSKTAGWRQKHGSKVFYFNPDDLSSTRVNPVDQVTTIAKAQSISDLIIRNTLMTKNTGGDPIWETSERHLLTSLLMHVSAEKGDLAMVRRLLIEGADRLGPILANSRVKAASNEYGGFLRTSSEGFRNGVFSGLMQRLNLWINPRIVALTDRTDFDVASLAGELFTFYLAVPAQKKILKPAAALVFNYLLDMALEAPLSSFKFPLALFLDEFTNFGMIPAIADKMGIIRHRQMPAMLGFQDYVQLRAVYGEDDATFLFGQPGTRFFFRTRELATSERVSKLLGQETVVERKLTTNCSVQEREFGKPLLSPGELMAIPPEESVVFTPSTPPVKLKRFTWRDYVDQMSVPAPEREQIEIDERLIKDCKEQEVSPTWEQEWEAKHKGKPAPAPHSETPKDTKQATEPKKEPKKETVTAEDETNEIKQEAVINTATEPDEEDDLPI